VEHHSRVCPAVRHQQRGGSARARAERQPSVSARGARRAGGFWRGRCVRATLHRSPRNLALQPVVPRTPRSRGCSSTHDEQQHGVLARGTVRTQLRRRRAWLSCPTACCWLARRGSGARVGAQHRNAPQLSWVSIHTQLAAGWTARATPPRHANLAAARAAAFAVSRRQSTVLYICVTQACRPCASQRCECSTGRRSRAGPARCPRQ
jgi:hypothetical protein